MWAKIVKLIFVTIIGAAAFGSVLILSVFAYVGANTIFRDYGSTIHYKVPISENAPNVIFSLGESFVSLLLSVPLLVLSILIITVWFLLCVWILHNEIRRLILWLLSVIRRIRIYTEKGFFVGVIPEKEKVETKVVSADDTKMFP